MFQRLVMATCCLCLFWATPALAHFGMLIPASNLMARPGVLTLDLRFWHPMEGQGMNLVKPQEAGVAFKGKKTSLLGALKEKKVDGFTTWQARYQIKAPGDYIFYMIPQPYWEPSEDCFIIHYTKTVVDALEAEEGWDQPVGLPMEIVPLSKPFGLYAGNNFSGVVLYKGKPLAGAVVEVEFYNVGGKLKAPAGAYVTQLVKADSNGVFNWGIPWPGWWGFAALHTADDFKLKHQGKDKDVELGGVIWIYAHPALATQKGN
jgi:cobalt/nickel transport protein